MTPLELRASLSLSSIYALRMLGLFLVLPVFAIEARKYPGGEDPALVGLAIGIFGLTQGLLQLPFGMASDRLGRKRVIIAGLLLFALGSFVAAAATTVMGLLIGRSLQGAGAISAAVSALLADQTRDEVRTKAMALVGGSIGLMFAVSLVLAPALIGWIGLHGMFDLIGVLALVGAAVMAWVVPPEPDHRNRGPAGKLSEVLTHIDMLRLDFGVFVLNAVQIAIWVAVPTLLVQAGLAKESHWQVYLPTVLASFGLLGGVLFPMERRGHLRAVFLAAIVALTVVQPGFLLVASGAPTVMQLSVLLLVFFCGFNILEACQPSMASRLVPEHLRGSALGVYNTLQSLGLFVGGAAGGQLVKRFGVQGLFGVCTLAMLAWLVVAWPMKAPPLRKPAVDNAAKNA